MLSRAGVSVLVFALALSVAAGVSATHEGDEPVRGDDPGLTKPVLIAKKLATFPSWARARGIQGKVTIEAVIRKDGTVGDAVVVESNPAGLGFEAAAVQVLQHWRYKPGIKDGEPVDVSFTIVVESTLGSGGRSTYPSGQKWAEHLANADDALEDGRLQAALQSAEWALFEATQFPADDPRLPPTLEFLARIQIGQQDVAEAIALLERAREERLARLGGSDPELLPLLDTLSSLYLLEERPADAEAPLALAIKILKRRKGSPDLLPVLLARYHGVLLSLGRDDQAANVARKMERLQARD